MIAVGFLGLVAVPVAVGFEDEDPVVVGGNDTLSLDKYPIRSICGLQMSIHDEASLPVAP